MLVEEIDLSIAPLALLERLAAEPGLAYLDGVTTPHGRRFALIGSRPVATCTIRGDGVTATSPPALDAVAAEPLVTLRRFLESLPRPGHRHPFPLRAAAIGYFAYEFHTTLAPGVAPHGRDDLQLPRLVLGLYDPLLLHDQDAHRYYIASTSRARLHDRARELRERAAPGPGLALGPIDPDPPGVPASARSNMTLAEYRDALARIREHIVAGDVYQINLTQRFAAPLRGHPLRLFTHLARSHPMPRSAYLDAGDFQIVSNSPELFLERHGRRLSTRPIKGTRRRSRAPEEDARLRQELLTDAKERAEHIMIVDLERNDLGRICRTGSVHVRTLAALESYPSLHHLVSTVEGEVRDGIDLLDILQATFPGGSVTGAPKIRAMELIGGLEPHTRGVYTGAMGVIDGAGDLCLNLPIRTAVAMGGHGYVGTGGGIVADSSPEAEYAESLLKVEAILGALGARSGRAA